LSNQLIEVLFNGLSSIYISEYSPVFSSRSLRDFEEFPSKVDLDISLSAFVKSNLICIIKIENSLVWSPILDCGIIGCSLLKLFLFKKSVIIEWIKAESFISEWECRLINNQIPMEVLPSSIVILIDSVFRVNFVHKNSTSILLLKFMKSLYEFRLIIKSIGENKSSVSILLSIFKHDFALIWKNFSHSGAWIGP